jgi:hypothetical protein
LSFVFKFSAKVINKNENAKEIGKNLFSYFLLSYFFPIFIGKGQKTSKGRYIYYNLYNITILYKSYNHPRTLLKTPKSKKVRSKKVRNRL